MKQLNLLFTAHNLVELAGSKTHAVTLARAAKRQGHKVAIASKKGINGPMFDLAKAVAPVIDYRFLNEAKPNSFDIGVVSPGSVCYTPDLAKACKKVIQVCHGIVDAERPVEGPDAYVAVSEEVYDIIGVEPKSIVRNPINLERFEPTEPLNSKVKVVAHISNYNDIPELEEACHNLGIRFIRTHQHPKPWEVMREADLVVALGRSALEAMACGREVLIYGNRNYMGAAYCDGFASERYFQARRFNLSGRDSRSRVNVPALEVALRNASPANGKVCREYIEQYHDSEKILQQILGLVEV